jgi:hypothetical protein
VQQVDHVQISFSDVFVVAAISPIASLTSTVCSDGFNGAVLTPHWRNQQIYGG